MNVASARNGALTPLQSLILRRWRPQWVCPSRAVRVVPRRRYAIETKAEAQKPYYVTTPIFYVNAGMLDSTRKHALQPAEIDMQLHMLAISIPWS